MKKVVLFCAVMLNALCYGQSFDGNLGSKSLNWSQDQKDFNSGPRVGLNPMSVRLWDNYNGANSPSLYGSLLEINGRVNHLVSQLYFVGTGADNDRIKYRTAFYGQNAWTEWRYLLDSKNDIESTGSLKILGNGNSFILNGNFGLGTSQPTSPFSIGTNHGIKLSIGNSLWTNSTIIVTGYTEQTGDFTDIKAASYGYSKGLIRILQNGNVGIGVTNPDSKLTVAGNIHAQEVKVTVNAGMVPDYVFANDYKLKSLQEVENYIKENNHLPEISSAQEIEKNGLMLAEMNMNLLKKIEEMTLYIIEQNKQIIDLNKRLEKVESK